LPAGVVFVGGGCKMPGLVDLTKQELRLPAKIGSPDLSQFEIINNELTAELDDPEYACCLGLLLWGRENTNFRFSPLNMSFGKMFKKVIDYFIP
jgi:cell division ATPase FtsA